LTVLSVGVRHPALFVILSDSALPPDITDLAIWLL